MSETEAGKPDDEINENQSEFLSYVYNSDLPAEVEESGLLSYEVGPDAQEVVPEI